jgi:pimeloyl-ACP methyl ester carboxylesterase
MSGNATPSGSAQSIDLPRTEDGDGEAVIMVHGSNSDRRIWNQHIPMIGSRYRVIAISQRYFGTDSWPDTGERFSVSVLADDLASFVRGLESAPVTIVGWSLGGAVALTMALRVRALVRRVILYEPSLTTFVTDAAHAKAAAEDRSVMMAAAKALVSAGNLAGAVRSFMDGVNGESGAFDRLAPEIRAMMIENARMLPLLFAGPPPPPVTAEDLRAFGCPVTIGLGAESRPLYQIAARTAHSLLPSSRLEVVRGAKHLWPIQDPARFSDFVIHAMNRE